MAQESTKTKEKIDNQTTKTQNIKIIDVLKMRFYKHKNENKTVLDSILNL